MVRLFKYPSRVGMVKRHSCWNFPQELTQRGVSGVVRLGFSGRKLGMQNAKQPNMKKNILKKNESGRIGVPALLYFLGVPGILCVVLWAIFFKGA